MSNYDNDEGIKNHVEDGETLEDWLAEMGVDYDSLGEEEKAIARDKWNGNCGDDNEDN